MFPAFPQRRTTGAKLGKNRTKKTNRFDRDVVHLMGDPTRTASSSSSTTNHHHKTGHNKDLTHGQPPPYHHPCPPPSPSNLTILDDLGEEENNNHREDEGARLGGGPLPSYSSSDSYTAGFIISDITAGSYYLKNNKLHHPVDDNYHPVQTNTKNKGGNEHGHDPAAGPMEYEQILKDLANVAADTKKSKRREEGLVDVQCGCWPFHSATRR